MSYLECALFTQIVCFSFVHKTDKNGSNFLRGHIYLDSDYLFYMKDVFLLYTYIPLFYFRSFFFFLSLAEFGCEYEGNRENSPSDEENQKVSFLLEDKLTSLEKFNQHFQMK